MKFATSVKIALPRERIVHLLSDPQSDRSGYEARYRVEGRTRIGAEDH